MVSAKKKSTTAPLSYRLRRSRVHGNGLFATRPIKKGERIIEYTGERISHEEADRRHEHKAIDDNHTFLFTIDAKTVIDGGVGGNDSRYINHSCDPNCEVIMVRGRPFVEAVRAIGAGEELAYDYHLNRAPEDPPEIDVIFACHCGAKTCRGTMLVAPKTPKKAARKKAKRLAQPKRVAQPKTRAQPKKRAAKRRAKQR